MEALIVAAHLAIAHAAEVRAMIKQVIWGVVLSLTFGTGLLGRTPDVATPHTSGNNKVAIRIRNYARVPSSVLRQAEQTTSSAFREAGVEVVWSVCPITLSSAYEAEDVCVGPLNPRSMILNLLPESMTKRLNLQGDAFGVAMESTVDHSAFFGSVFYDKVKDRALIERIDLAPFLGAVMAHELGHILLGRHSHSGTGLMSADWSRKEIHAAEQRGLAFAPFEAKQIQKAVFIRSLVASHETVGADESSTRTVADPSTKIHSGNEMPFRISSGYLIEVEGRIGANTNLKFVLDTGSTTSIVDTHLADKLQLQRHHTESLNFNRMLAWGVATVPEIQFGPIKVQNSQVFVGRLGEYSEFTKKVDAIIGLDLLKQSNFSIDYDVKKVIFHPRSQYEDTHTSSEPASECVVLESQVQGQVVRLIVDTGFSGLLLYRERILKRIPKLRLAGNSKLVLVGDRLKATRVLIPDVVLGSKNEELSVLLVDAPPEYTLPGIDGIVGLTALRARRIHFNFVERTLSWE